MRTKTTRRLVLITLLALLCTGCGKKGGEDSPEEPLRVAVIPKGSTHVFWKSVHAGCVKAQRELEAAGTAVEIIWKGPLTENDRSAQISVVENFISQGVDGIMLAPLDDSALVAPVDKAARAGIPVIIFDSGLNTDKIVSFVATDNLVGGQLAGNQLAKLLGEKGKVILLRYMEGSASTEKRERGFLDAISKFPGITVVSDNIYAGTSRATAQEAGENILNRFGDEVDGIFCPNESSTVGMLLALKRHGRAGGKVSLIGFDGGEQNMRALRDGDIQGLVIQNPVNMGYLGLMNTVDHIRGNPVDAHVDTGSTLVTLENIGDPELQELIDPPLAEYLD